MQRLTSRCRRQRPRLLAETPNGFSLGGAIDNTAGSRTYKWTYSGSRTAENGFLVRARAASPCRYYLPVVVGKDTEIEVAGNRATVCRNGTRFVVTSSLPIKVRHTERGDRAFTTIGGLMTEHLYVELIQTRNLNCLFPNEMHG